MCLCVIYVVIINMHLTSGVNSFSHCFFFDFSKKRDCQRKTTERGRKDIGKCS